MNTGTGVVTGVCVSHDRASVEEIEAERFPDQATVVSTLLDRDGVSEAFALQTCHRIEAYVVAGDAADGRAALDALDLPGELATRTGHEESLRHLLRVAAGLESIVLGEDQILGQVRQAFEEAREAGGVGPLLDDAVAKAIHVGERARTETAINEGVVSMGSAAARLAEAEHDLAGKAALVVGAGEMGTLAAKALATTDLARVGVANRTPAAARQVVVELPTDGEASGLDGLDARLADADVVVSATGSDGPLLDGDALGDAGETVVVDLGQPRDLAPAAADLPSVTAYDIDDLEAVTDATREQRAEAAETVAAMVAEEFDHLLDQQKRKRADEVIGTMYASADRLKQRELATAFSQLDSAGTLTDDQREVVRSMADALVSKLLSAPTKSLRQAAAEDDWSTVHTALQLFNPEFGEDSPFDLPAAGEGDAAPPGTVAGLPEDAPEHVKQMVAAADGERPDWMPEGTPEEIEHLLAETEPAADALDSATLPEPPKAESEDD